MTTDNGYKGERLTWGPDEFEIESPESRTEAVRASAVDDPDLDEIEAWAEEDPDDFDDEVVERAAAGHDVTLGHDELHHYWTRGQGLAKWVGSPKPWTTLVAHLTKYVGPIKAKIYASRWFIEVFGFAAGSDLNRVTHGHPPRGHRVGPG